MSFPMEIRQMTVDALLDLQGPSSPLGILLGNLALIPDVLYKIVRFESGDTYKKAERIETILREMYGEVEHARSHTYH
jgi:hypothetical protein